MHDAPVAVIIVQWIMQRRAVVPQCQRPGAPLEAAGELWLDLMLVQIIQQRGAFVHCPILEAQGMPDVDIKRAASRFGMRAHHWMLGLKHLVGARGRAVGHAIFARL